MPFRQASISAAPKITLPPVTRTAMRCLACFPPLRLQCPPFLGRCGGPSTRAFSCSSPVQAPKRQQPLYDFTLPTIDARGRPQYRGRLSPGHKIRERVLRNQFGIKRDRWESGELAEIMGGWEDEEVASSSWVRGREPTIDDFGLRTPAEGRRDQRERRDDEREPSDAKVFSSRFILRRDQESKMAGRGERGKPPGSKFGLRSTERSTPFSSSEPEHAASSRKNSQDSPFASRFCRSTRRQADSQDEFDSHEKDAPSGGDLMSPRREGERRERRQNRDEPRARFGTSPADSIPARLRMESSQRPGGPTGDEVPCPFSDSRTPTGKLPWQPTKKLTIPAMAGLRALHAADPKTFTREVLSERFGISYEAVTRILRSKFIEREGGVAGEGENGDAVGRAKELRGTKWDQAPATGEGVSPVPAIQRAFAQRAWLGTPVVKQRSSSSASG